MPRFEIVNVPPVSCSPVERVGPRRGGQRLALDADLAQAQGIGVCSTGTIRPSSRATAMPMLTSPWRTIASGSKLAFTPGWNRKRQRDGLGDEVAERELDPLGGELLVDLLAGGDQPIDADVDGQVDLGGGLLGLDIRWAIVLRIRECGMRWAASGGGGRGGGAGAAGRGPPAGGAAAGCRRACGSP